MGFAARRGAAMKVEAVREERAGGVRVVARRAGAEVVKAGIMVVTDWVRWGAMDGGGGMGVECGWTEVRY